MKPWFREWAKAFGQAMWAYRAQSAVQPLPDNFTSHSTHPLDEHRQSTPQWTCDIHGNVWDWQDVVCPSCVNEWHPVEEDEDA